MGYYYRGYRRRRYRYRRSRGNGGSSSPSSRPARLYTGIDDDVRRMFFALDLFTLKLVFNRYEAEYGEGKRKYAENTFKRWRSGEVQMGGEISGRLIRLVPSFLTFDQKYELIEKLWSRFRQKTTLNITISPASGVEAAIEAVMDAVDAVGEQEIPTAVAERLEWLASDDAIAAQSLLSEVAKREGEIAVQTLETELRQILALAIQHQDKSVSGTRTVSLPAATVYIHVSQSAPSAPRNRAMSSESSRGQNEKPGELARSQENQPTRDLAPIQNPSDLLGEALRRMSPQKQEEIIGKATDEALRLQVKHKEGKLDHEMASSKVDSVAEAANRLGNTGADFEVKAEHRSEHGSVQVTVRSQKQSLAERVGKCFVATACYEDAAHPTVIALSEFRDTVLRPRPAGRAFIRWYYRNSPPFARILQRHPGLRFAGRVVLYPISVGAQMVNRRVPSDSRQRDAQIPR